jgi:hypothetical protein
MTTQRTPGSAAAVRTAARRVSLVAVSRLFIPAGRFKVMVAMAPSTTYNTGGESGI